MENGKKLKSIVEDRWTLRPFLLPAFSLASGRKGKQEGSKFHRSLSLSLAIESKKEKEKHSVESVSNERFILLKPWFNDQPY